VPVLQGRANGAGVASEANGAHALRVLVVDDQLLLRDTLMRLLGDAGVEVTGTACSVAEAARLAGRHEPDLVLVAMLPEHLDRARAYLQAEPVTTATLTKREREVVASLAEGLSNAEIGARLSISTNTVRNHVQSVLSKLSARSRLQAVAIAAREGLVGKVSR